MTRIDDTVLLAVVIYVLYATDRIIPDLDTCIRYYIDIVKQ